MNVNVKRTEHPRPPIANVTVDLTPWEVREIVEAYRYSQRNHTEPCKSSTLSQLVYRLRQEIA